MARDIYISKRASVSGFSFANLGLFIGFATGTVQFHDTDTNIKMDIAFGVK